jgi:hypothetical protein
MSIEEKEKSKEETKQVEEEIHSEDFQFVLKELLEAYRPILEEDLKRSKELKRLKEEVQEKPPSCEDEIVLADRLFKPFSREEVVLRLLDPEARERFGTVEERSWCLRHLICCLKFGWLLYRARTFRAAVYYLHNYWICVRRILGVDPSDRPLTEEEKADIKSLVQGLAEVYKPFLTEQLRNTEFPADLTEEIITGKLDCMEGITESTQIFDRFLSPELAVALFGKEAFEKYKEDPRFWLCRCLCICAIKFGWCLARAKNFLDVVRCLLYFLRCIRICFWPLTCKLNEPNGCVEENAIPAKNIFRGIEIKGTATGVFCSHYTLEWREAGSVPWRNDGIHYIGSPQPPQGICGIVNGTLGYLETAPMVPAGPVEIRLCVFSTQPGVAAKCCTTLFELKRNLVWIRGVEGIEADTPPGIFDPTAQLKDASGEVRSFGTAVKIFGSAWIGGCVASNIKKYTLNYYPGFVVDPLLPGYVQFWQVDYNTPLQIDSDLNKVFERELTNRWREAKWCLPSPPFPPGSCFTFSNYLQGVRWSTQVPRSYPVEPPGPPFWNSTPLPTINCQSGKYTIRLTVEDTIGNIKHDLQQVWFDNKNIYGKITQIAGVSTCSTVTLSQFAVDGGNCKVPWPAKLLGIAFDEYIEEGNSTPPSDNFDEYRLWIRKDGGPWFTIPIPGPIGPPFIGTSRIGDPGERCLTASPPPGPIPPETPGILTILDMRRLDAVCNPSEPALTLKRGECCGYIVRLRVQDKSICPSLSAGRHRVWDHFPFCICNDLR